MIIVSPFHLRIFCDSMKSERNHFCVWNKTKKWKAGRHLGKVLTGFQFYEKVLKSSFKVHLLMTLQNLQNSEEIYDQ